MCVKPIKLVNRERKSMKEYYTNVVPCGRCAECLENRRAQWSFRLKQQLKVSDNSTFLTLTYSDENLSDNKYLVKSDLVRYFKRVRSVESDLKYYGVGEYGGLFKRPHFHAIVFNADREVLIDKWQDRGIVDCGDVSDASIHYVTGYIINDYKSDHPAPPFAIMSKGLGANYVNKWTIHFHNQLKDTTVMHPGGIAGVMPRYYREKIFNKLTLSEIGSRKLKEKDLRMNKTKNSDLQAERKVKIIKNLRTKKDKL